MPIRLDFRPDLEEPRRFRRTRNDNYVSFRELGRRPSTGGHLPFCHQPEPRVGIDGNPDRDDRRERDYYSRQITRNGETTIRFRRLSVPVKITTLSHCVTGLTNDRGETFDERVPPIDKFRPVFETRTTRESMEKNDRAIERETVLDAGRDTLTRALLLRGTDYLRVVDKLLVTKPNVTRERRNTRASRSSITHRASRYQPALLLNRASGTKRSEIGTTGIGTRRRANMFREKNG